MSAQWRFKVLFILLSFVISYGSVFPTVVHFNDGNLEQAVRDSLDKPTGDITDVDMTTLTVFSAWNKGIVDLTGMEYAINLERLSFWGNNIGNINALSGLVNLQKLVLSINQIRDISPIINLTNLKKVYLNSNRINDIDVLSHLTNLNFLYIGSNYIYDLSALANLTNLDTLNLDDNQIADLSPLSNLTGLTCLSVDRNHVLSDISPLSNLVNLQELWVCSNQVNDISTLSSLTNLRYLYLNEEKINDISSLANLTNLKLLSIGDNQIADISSLSNLTNLESLAIFSNQLDDGDLPSLYHLNIKNTKENMLMYDGSQQKGYLDLRGNLGFTQQAIQTLANELPFIDYSHIFWNQATISSDWEKVYIDTLIQVPSEQGGVPAIGDLEDDADMDILATYVTGATEESLAGEISWYQSPDWEKHVIANDLGVMKTADINHDGKRDIVAANFQAGEVVWYEAPSWTRHVIGILPNAMYIDVADLDKDGDLDVVVDQIEAGSGNLFWYEAPYWSVHTIGTCPNDVGWLVTADMNSDGNSDVLVSSQSGIFLYEWPDWTVRSITGTTAGIFQCSQIDAGDIDGDGDTDVVYSNEKQNMVAWYENPSWTQHIIDENFAGAEGAALADLDKDGNLDVIASGNTSNEVVWYESPFWNKHVIDGSLDHAAMLCAGDVDGDGLTDVVVCTEYDHIVLYKNRMTVNPVDNKIAQIPKALKLRQNYPNPFNPLTKIQFELSKAGNIKLTILNVSGRELLTLINGYKSAGIHEIDFNAKDMASGIYYYRLETDSAVETRKMLLLR